MRNDAAKKTITKEVVQYVARLSRLRLNEKDIGVFQDQLARILDYVAQLNEVDTENTAPTTHVLPSMKNVFREDKIQPSLSPEEALSGAPSREGDFFKVPKVIKDA